MSTKNKINIPKPLEKGFGIQPIHETPLPKPVDTGKNNGNKK